MAAEGQPVSATRAPHTTTAQRHHDVSSLLADSCSHAAGRPAAAMRFSRGRRAVRTGTDNAEGCPEGHTDPRRLLALLARWWLCALCSQGMERAWRFRDAGALRPRRLLPLLRV